MLLILLEFILISICIVHLHFVWLYNYWGTKGVPYLTPKIPKGNIGIYKKNHISHDLDAIYKHMKEKGRKFCGVYLYDRPIFLPIHPEVTKRILERKFPSCYYKDGNNFVCKQKKLEEICEKFADKTFAEKFSGVVEVRNVISEYVGGCLGLYLFGEVNNESILYCGKLVGRNFTTKMRLALLYPKVFDFLRVGGDPNESKIFFQKWLLKRIAKGISWGWDDLNFLKDLLENDWKIPEILDAILQLYKNCYEEAVSVTMHGLVEMGTDFKVQDKLREDLKKDSQIYLDYVMNETVRKHPVYPILAQKTTVALEIDQIRISKNTKIFIPIYSLVNDEEIFPEPERFIPERFEKESTIFCPLGKGEEIIKIIAKTAITNLISKFRWKNTENSIPEDEYSPETYLGINSRKFYLNFEKI